MSERFMKNFNGEKVFSLEYDKETLRDMVIEKQQEIERLNNIIEELKKEIEKLTRKIDIKDAWCGRLANAGFDYDGYHKAKDLKELIDELVDFSEKAIDCDDKTAAWIDENDKEFNILMEECDKE